MGRSPTIPRQATAERTLHAIVRVSGAVKHLAEERMGTFGISAAQWGILRTLNRRHEEGEKPLRMSELGDALLVRPPGLSGAVARMERRHLVVRESDPLDHRERRIVLTDTGRALLAQALVNHVSWQRQLLAGLSAREQRTVADLLNKLSGHLAELDSNLHSHTAGLRSPVHKTGQGKRS